ncbi:MAG TPA: hypothetical protein VM076_10340 [Gemmatimonadaceae bacterium]|nr:hypothetical protein [Gemmatimonadaceae bacterium]
MNTRARSVALAIAVLSSNVSAQQQSDYSRLAARLDARTRTAVAALVDSARGIGLPIEPLIDKALEGAAKKATSQQIVAAVRTFAGQLAEARSALGNTSSEGELVGGAQAIRAGIPVKQLQRLRNVREGVRIAAALTVVSDLVSREVPIDTAVAVVSALVRASATDDQLLGVRADIETDILAGKPPAVAAMARGQALQQTLAANVPPNGAGSQGTLPSPSGTIRAGDQAGALKPPPSAVGRVTPADAPVKPRGTERKRP